MKKLAVVYYSMTGNTEAMANEVVAGAKEAGAEVSLFSSADFKADMLDQFDAIAFGCPAMGNEELEENEFEPLFAECEGKLGQKPIGPLAPTPGPSVNGWIPGKSVVPMAIYEWLIPSLPLRPRTMPLKKLVQA